MSFILGEFQSKFMNPGLSGVIDPMQLPAVVILDD
jgi:hypothetical protein